MTSQSSKKLSYKELERYCSDLERKLAASEENNSRLAAQLTDITKDRNWMRGLLENITIPIREKITLYGARRALRKKIKEMRADGLTHVYRSDISKFTGLTENQVGDALKKLKDRGIIDRKIEPHYNRETGKHEKHNLMALGELALENPKAIDFSDEDNWGGKREKKNKSCEHCGGEEFTVNTRAWCTSCGAKIRDDWKTLNEHTENNSEMEENN